MKNTKFETQGHFPPVCHLILPTPLNTTISKQENYKKTNIK